MPDTLQISATKPRVQYRADGVRCDYPFPFAVFAAADLEVWVGDQRITEDLSYAGIGETGGGVILFASPPEEGATVTIRRRLTLQRISDFQDSGPFRAAALNDELDYLTAALQQVAADTERTVRLPPTDGDGALVLPAAAERAGRALVFDQNGDVAIGPPDAGTGGGGGGGGGDGALPTWHTLDDIPEGSACKSFLAAEKEKLARVEDGAQANPGRVLPVERAEGTATTVRGFAPDDVREMVAAFAPPPPAPAVTSVAGRTGAVVLGQTDVGLGNVSDDAQLRADLDYAAKADPADGDKLLLKDQASGAPKLIDWNQLPAAAAAPVASVNGRTGAVVAQEGDYTLDQIAETASHVLMTPAERSKLARLASTPWWEGRTAADPAAAVKSLLDADSIGAAQTAIGGTTVGKALLTAADAGAARATLGLGGWVDVRQYGAVGDGVADDAAAVQRAIAAVAARPRGGVVYLPAGQYLIGTGLVIAGSNVCLVGDGIFQSLLITATDVATVTIGTNPITALTGCDVLNVGFYHTNAVAKTKAHLTLLSVIQSNYRVWLQNGALGLVVYGGQGIGLSVYAPGNYDPGADAKLNSARGITLDAASSAPGYASGTGCVELPTEVTFRDIYLNGPRMKGWQYGVAIFAGEHVTFSGAYYVGQCTNSNIRIEQTASNRLILEVKLERGGYIDGAGAYGIYLGGPTGNGSSYIGSVSIDCDVKGQTGDGGVGIFVDGTPRGGPSPQAMCNLSITGHVSGWNTDGIRINGGKNISVTGAKVWGNSFHAINTGFGLLFGPYVDGATVMGGHFGGGIDGTGTGNQISGIALDPAAKNVVIVGANVRGNQIPLVYTPNAGTSGNRIINCAGFSENRPAGIPPMPGSNVDLYNPYGSPASVMIFGGAVTQILLNGFVLFSGVASVPIPVGPGDRLRIVYSSAPSWVWWPA